MASELLMSVSQDEHERAVFRSRRMAETDRMSDLATAEERGERRGEIRGEIRGERRGIAKGIDIGRSKGIAEGIDIGRSKGIAEGIDIGRAKGIAEERKRRDKEIVLHMLSFGRPISEIKAMTDLTESEIKEIAEQK